MNKRSELISTVRVELIPSLLTEIIHLSPHSFTYITIYHTKHAFTDLSTSSIRASMFSRCVSCWSPIPWSKADVQMVKRGSRSIRPRLCTRASRRCVLILLRVSITTYNPGKGVDFYSHLGIDSSATLNQLNKAYRKKSLELQ
jgi:hypothetical protein